METVNERQPPLIRIVIADEEAAFRAAMKRLLGSRDVQIVGEASDARRAAELTSELKPDVLLLEFSLCRKFGLRVLNGSSTSTRLVRIIVMVGIADKAQILEALRL